MFTVHPPEPEAGHVPHPQAVWIDLLNPTEAEARQVAEATGLHVPTREELSEIESSSRLQRRAGVLFMSVPTAAPGLTPSPVGYVLSRERLITVRFARLPSFESFAHACSLDPETTANAMEVFLGLLEAVVDRLADALERETGALEDASRRVFHPQKLRRTRRPEGELRTLLREIGLAGEQSGRARDTLLGVGRIAQFVSTSAKDWIAEDQKVRFKTLRADIRSLAEYQERLGETVQFLLDATLGLINIEQNNVIKVLTIVSIVGIPPTFIASLYGMNFHDIPELNWSFGYWYALGLMAVSAVAPLLWFWVRGWL